MFPDLSKSDKVEDSVSCQMLSSSSILSIQDEPVFRTHHSSVQVQSQVTKDNSAACGSELYTGFQICSRFSSLQEKIDLLPLKLLIPTYLANSDQDDNRYFSYSTSLLDHLSAQKDSSDNYIFSDIKNIEITTDVMRNSLPFNKIIGTDYFCDRLTFQGKVLDSSSIAEYANSSLQQDPVEKNTIIQDVPNCDSISNADSKRFCLPLTESFSSPQLSVKSDITQLEPSETTEVTIQNRSTSNKEENYRKTQSFSMSQLYSGDIETLLNHADQLLSYATAELGEWRRTKTVDADLSVISRISATVDSNHVGSTPHSELLFSSNSEESHDTIVKKDFANKNNIELFSDSFSFLPNRDVLSEDDIENNSLKARISEKMEDTFGNCEDLLENSFFLGWSDILSCVKPRFLSLTENSSSIGVSPHVGDNRISTYHENALNLDDKRQSHTTIPMNLKANSPVTLSGGMIESLKSITNHDDNDNHSVAKIQVHCNSLNLNLGEFKNPVPGLKSTDSSCEELESSMDFWMLSSKILYDYSSKSEEEHDEINEGLLEIEGSPGSLDRRAEWSEFENILISRIPSERCRMRQEEERMLLRNEEERKFHEKMVRMLEVCASEEEKFRTCLFEEYQSSLESIVIERDLLFQNHAKKLRHEEFIKLQHMIRLLEEQANQERYLSELSMRDFFNLTFSAFFQVKSIILSYKDYSSSKCEIVKDFQHALMFHSTQIIFNISRKRLAARTLNSYQKRVNLKPYTTGEAFSTLARHFYFSNLSLFLLISSCYKYILDSQNSKSNQFLVPDHFSSNAIVSDQINANSPQHDSNIAITSLINVDADEASNGSAFLCDISTNSTKPPRQVIDNLYANNHTFFKDSTTASDGIILTGPLLIQMHQRIFDYASKNIFKASVYFKNVTCCMKKIASIDWESIASVRIGNNPCVLSRDSEKSEISPITPSIDFCNNKTQNFQACNPSYIKDYFPRVNVSFGPFVEKLNLSNNCISELSLIDLLHVFPSLQSLNIHDNCIASFSPIRTSLLINNQELFPIGETQSNLSSIVIDNLPASMTTVLKEHLNQAQSVSQYKDSKTFRLLEDEDQSLPSNNVTFCDISSNSINNISELCLTFVHLETLIAYSNCIRLIEPITSLILLTYLDLRSNEIEDLSPLKCLKRLKFINISQNRVISLDSLANLPFLQKIYASHNRISKWTPFQSLFLEQLFLDQNYLAYIPEEVGWLPSLVYLHLEGNRLQHLNGILRLFNLQRLSLARNNICDDNELTFLSLPKLKSLTLDGNPISIRFVDRFEIFKILKLSYIPHLEELDSEVFPKLHNDSVVESSNPLEEYAYYINKMILLHGPSLSWIKQIIPYHLFSHQRILKLVENNNLSMKELFEAITRETAFSENSKASTISTKFECEKSCNAHFLFEILSLCCFLLQRYEWIKHDIRQWRLYQGDVIEDIKTMENNETQRLNQVCDSPEFFFPENISKDISLKFLIRGSLHSEKSIQGINQEELYLMTYLWHDFLKELIPFSQSSCNISSYAIIWSPYVIRKKIQKSFAKNYLQEWFIYLKKRRSTFKSNTDLPFILNSMHLPKYIIPFTRLQALWRGSIIRRRLRDGNCFSLQDLSIETFVQQEVPDITFIRPFRDVMEDIMNVCDANIADIKLVSMNSASKSTNPHSKGNHQTTESYSDDKSLPNSVITPIGDNLVPARVSNSNNPSFIPYSQSLEVRTNNNTDLEEEIAWFSSEPSSLEGEGKLSLSVTDFEKYTNTDSELLLTENSSEDSQKKHGWSKEIRVLMKKKVKKLKCMNRQRLK